MTIRGRVGAAIDWLNGICRSVAAKHSFWRSERGSALVETALVISFILFPMLVGTVELGEMVFDSIEISNAAHAGAIYGMISSTDAADTAGIQTAAQAEAPEFNTGLNVQSSVFYVCSNAIGGLQYTTQAAATTACTGLTHSLEFVQVSTSATITPPILCPALPSTFTLHGYSVMEVTE